MSMMETKYDYLLNAQTRLRVAFKTGRGKVVQFVVQLELFQEDAWKPIMRYDTGHGFAHRDRYLPDGAVSKHEQLPVSDLDEALTYAIHTMKRDWMELCQEFIARRAKPRRR